MAFQLAEGEEFVGCPYDVSHTSVTNLRYLAHVNKCRLAYKKKMGESGKKIAYGTCPFNDLHRMPKIELMHHTKLCQNRNDPISSVSTAMNKMSVTPAETTSSGKEKLADQIPIPSGQYDKIQKETISAETFNLNANPSASGEPDEWDVTPDACGYDPSQKVASGQFIVTTQGTKSEKKKQRSENRKQWLNGSN